MPGIKNPRKGLIARIVAAYPIYLFLAPTLLLIVVFTYYPAFSGFYHSLFNWSYFGESVFVGFENYKRIFTDTIFGLSMLNMLLLTAFNVFVKSLVVPITVAEILFAVRSNKAQYFYRILMLLPLVVPGVVIWFIWRFIYDPNVGLLNSVFDGLGLDFLKSNWLSDPKTALLSIMLIQFPWVSGAAVLIYYAGLSTIGQTLFDSAMLDGVKGLKRILKIDLPLIKGQIKFFLVLGVIDNLQGYQIALVLTNGGPLNATMLPGLHMYKEAFAYQRMGYASTIGVVIFLMILILTIINNRFIKTDPGA